MVQRWNSEPAFEKLQDNMVQRWNSKPAFGRLDRLDHEFNLLNL